MSIGDSIQDLPDSISNLRKTAPYRPLPTLNEPFLLNNVVTRNYKTQYANIYFTRLLQLRPVVARVAAERWGKTPGELMQLLFQGGERERCV